MLWYQKFQKLVRQIYKPKSIDRAADTYGKLTTLYAFLAWNALGIAGYGFYKSYTSSSKLSPIEAEGLSPGQIWAKESGKNNVKIYRIGGFGIDKSEIRPSSEEGASEPH